MFNHSGQRGYGGGTSRRWTPARVYRDALDRQERQLVLRVETRGRRVRQPAEGDVVEDVVSGQPLRSALPDCIDVTPKLRSGGPPGRMRQSPVDETVSVHACTLKL